MFASELYDILSKVQNYNPVLNQLVREGKLTAEDLTIWQDNVVALAEREGFLEESVTTDEEKWYERNLSSTSPFRITQF